mmetsp:Transcript_2361/g.6324  ORF Transcript_2361/g.6324 Transcript_2361/m.6324 type:complete len:246 (+) Transcript_2361:460-1197(+)
MVLGGQVHFHGVRDAPQLLPHARGVHGLPETKAPAVGGENEGAAGAHPVQAAWAGGGGGRQRLRWRGPHAAHAGRTRWGRRVDRQAAGEGGGRCDNARLGSADSASHCGRVRPRRHRICPRPLRRRRQRVRGPRLQQVGSIRRCAGGPRRCGAGACGSPCQHPHSGLQRPHAALHRGCERAPRSGPRALKPGCQGQRGCGGSVRVLHSSAHRRGGRARGRGAGPRRWRRRRERSDVERRDSLALR